MSATPSTLLDEAPGRAKPAMPLLAKRKPSGPGDVAIVSVLGVLTFVFLIPLLFILVNSFKGKFYISNSPFSLPGGKTFAGLDNYATGLSLSGFARAIGWSFFITAASVVVIVFFCAMTAYYITRVKNKFTSILYYMFAFSVVAVS